uniref:Uncharacterized protein n=1 Tax=Plectus sambesii TaxID=2011161 RepID=A0A914V789_9BILA
MAANPECLDTMQSSLLKYTGHMGADAQLAAEKDTFDSHLGALLQKMLLTAINEYESSTPTYRKAKKQELVVLLSSLVTFCVQFLQNSGSNRSFASLNTLNKIIDTGLVFDLFTVPDTVFHSSRLLNRTHDFDACDDLDETNSTVDHVFFYGPPASATPKKEQSKRRPDLMSALSAIEPSFVIAMLHNAITMQNREVGARS